MENTGNEINAVKKELYAKVDALYALHKCNTAAQLIEFANHEPFELMQLQQQVYNSVRAACYVGMKADGIEYPEVFWARKIDAAYDYPVFKQIKDQAIDIKQPTEVRNEKEETNSAKCVAGIGVAGLGVAATLVSVLVDVSVLLTGLGIVAAVGGVLIIVSSTQNTNSHASSHTSSQTPSEQSQVHSILKKMNRVNKSIIDEWCSNVLKLVEKKAEEA